MAGLKQVLVSIFVLLFFGVISIAAIVGGVGMLTPSPISPEDIHVAPIVGTLAHHPQMRIYSNGEARSVTIMLTEYPYQKFVIEFDALEATRYNMMNSYLSQGDTMFLLVSAEDYKEKIEPGEETDYIAPVAVFGVRSTNQIYLTVENYCKKANSDSPWSGVFIMAIGVAFASPIVFYFYSLLIRPKKRRIVS